MKMPNSKSFDFGDSNNASSSTSRGCNRRMQWKWWAIFIGIVLLLLVVFFGGFYAGRTNALSNLSIGTTEAGTSARPTVAGTSARPTASVPELEWDGVCPRKTEACPISYRENPLLILISMDGFRPDYLDRGLTPTLKKLSQCGTRAPFMYSVFPSKTFPNHYSQVTGLNPVSHGIIDNTIYEPAKGKVFRPGTTEASKPYWWSAEPIWVTAEKQGKKAGCFFWPGSDVQINSTFPTYYRKYSSKVPYKDRVRTIFSWMDKPADQRPTFYTLYVNEPDHAAHVNGIESDAVNIQLRRVDEMITMLFAGFQERDLLDCVNVIMVSDHGMADTSCDKVIPLDQYLNISEVYSIAGAFGRIRLKGLKNTTAEQFTLETLQCGDSHMRAYRKENLPVRYHYSSSARIEPIFLDLDVGWMLSNYAIADANNSFCYGGNHGYDNLFPDMRALFMAIGPSFKSNHFVEPFINTELYELMAELINITARANNGTKGSLHHLLKDPVLLSPQPSYNPPPTLKLPSDSLQVQMNLFAGNCSRSEVPDKLNMSDFEMNNARSRHTPFGIPHRHFDNDTVRLLYHLDFISAFDVKYKLSLWTAFSLSGKVNVSQEEPEWNADARISFKDSIECTFYEDPKVVNNGILQRPLFPLSFAGEDGIEEASLVTNAVPKTQDHVTYLEKAFYNMLSEWAEEEHSINVIIGPAFDFLKTNVYPGPGYIMQSHEKYGPLVVPTHYYAVITWCKNTSLSVSNCEPGRLDVVAFLLPNDPVPNNCEPSKDMIIKNAARVADVEILTGISFFTDLPVYDAIRLRTAVPQHHLKS